MTLDLPALRTLAWRTFDCDSCGELAGRRCVTDTGNRTTPHKPRLDLARGWDARQPDLDALNAQLSSLLAERESAVQAATEAGFKAGASSRQPEVETLSADLQAAGVEVTGLKEHVASLERDLSATTAERDALQKRVDELTKPVPTPTPIPAGKMLIGAAHGSNTDPAPIETVLGRKLNLRRTYWKGTAAQVAAAVAMAKGDLAKGRTPFLSFKLPASWAEMASGSQDAWVTNLRDKLAALDGPVWVVLHHEPEGDGTIADWLAMQKHCLPLLATGKIVPGVCVTGYQQVTGGGIKFGDCWPGSVAKFFAVDLYQRYGTTKDGKKQTTWTDLKGQLAKVNAFAKSVGVPWVNAETGITDDAFAARPSAMADLFAAHRDNDCAALCYFDTILNSAGSWPMTGAKLAAFAKAAG